MLEEIPRVREDLGFIPLVTPTSQIVGTQAVLNILTGERYKTITKETAGVLKGEYGAAMTPFNQELQMRVLDGAQAITCRPADLIEDELEKLTTELRGLAKEKNIKLAPGEREIDDVLTYALFPQVGLKFLQNRDNPDAFEPAPTLESAAASAAPNANPAAAAAEAPTVYTIGVNGQSYVVEVTEGGDISAVGVSNVVMSAAPVAAAAPAPVTGGEPVTAPLAGNIWKVHAVPGQSVQEGDVLLILEAMKMETEIRTSKAGTVTSVTAKEGDSVSVGDTLLTLA